MAKKNLTRYLAFFGINDLKYLVIKIAAALPSPLLYSYDCCCVYYTYVLLTAFKVCFWHYLIDYLYVCAKHCWMKITFSVLDPNWYLRRGTIVYSGWSDMMVRPTRVWLPKRVVKCFQGTHTLNRTCFIIILGSFKAQFGMHAKLTNTHFSIAIHTEYTFLKEN